MKQTPLIKNFVVVDDRWEGLVGDSNPGSSLMIYGIEGIESLKVLSLHSVQKRVEVERERKGRKNEEERESLEESRRGGGLVEW